MLAGAVIATVAVFGFDTIHVDRRVAILMIILSLLMFTTGIALVRQGHPYVLLVLFMPAAGLGLFGARKLIGKKEKND